MTRPATPPGHNGSHGHGHHHHGNGKGKGHDKHHCPVNPCLIAGTEILTDRGSMPIEELEVGDVLVTSKGPQPILHISRRDYTAAEVDADDSLLPYHYAPGQGRWVTVSKHHRIAVDGVLIAAHRLAAFDDFVCWQDVDGWEDAPVTWLNLYVEHHALITADGEQVETGWLGGPMAERTMGDDWPKVAHLAAGHRDNPALPFVTTLTKGASA